jgi:hypothetical protein
MDRSNGAGNRRWSHPETEARLKKRTVRTLVEDVVVDVDGQAGEIIAVVHWKGGVHTEIRIPRRRRGYNRAHTPKEIVDAVRVWCASARTIRLPAL